MTACFDYPKTARFGRLVPKSKVYGAARASVRVRQLFVDQVDRIVWQFKLAPETINLNISPVISEIQVFGVSLKTNTINHDILRTIDKAVAFPIIFELTKSGERKMIAAFKRPSEADNTKWVVSDYFETGWESVDNLRRPLPHALNLGTLYDRILSELIPVKPRTGETLSKLVARAKAIRTKEQNIAHIKTSIEREKQFNKKVAINAKLRTAMQELRHLRSNDVAET